MSTTVSNINESLVDQKVVEALRYTLPYLKMFSYAVESEGRIKDDVIYVPISTDPTAGTKTAGTFVTDSGTLAGTAVQLSNFAGAGWAFTEGTMRANLLPEAWADKAAGAVYAVAKSIVDAALGLVTISNFGNTEATDKLTKAVADFGQQEVALLVGYAENKIKQREKTLLLNTSYAAGLMGTSLFALTYSAAGSNVFASGNIPNVLGVPAAKYPAFPTNGEYLGGAIFGRAAILAAVAPPTTFMAGGEGNIKERRIITDPDSGISVMYTAKADAGGTLSGEVSVLYGVAKGQDAVVRLVTQ